MSSGSQIRQFEWSATEFCNLPARSAGLSLRYQVRNAALVRSGERPPGGREAATP